MMNKLLTLILLGSVFFSPIALAASESDYGTALAVKKHSEQFMVSAVLKLNGTDTTIRLVQSIEKADSKEQAIGMAFLKIRNEFTGYTVIDSIAELIKKEPSSECVYL